MEYEIQYTKAAERFFRVHEDIREQYKAAIAELLSGDNPELVDVKRISSKRNSYYRIRIGCYRIIYAIINGRIVVLNLPRLQKRGILEKFGTRTNA